MWARWTYIQRSLLPWLCEEIEPMTELLGRLITLLDVIGLEAFVPDPSSGAGRPQEDRRGLARAFVAKAVFGIPTTRALIDRLWRRPTTAPCLWLGEAGGRFLRKPRFPAPLLNLRKVICPIKCMRR